jgi:pyruvate,water dikinase
VEAADDADLLERVRRASAWFDRMLSEMMTVTLHAGTSRMMIERLAARAGEPDAANAITSGLGDVASAAPAIALWDLGRRAQSPGVRTHFDASADHLEDRLRDDPACRDFVEAFDRFLASFGFHGADELELSSPKWGTDPALALRIIERLRLAPADRDPREAARRLSHEREAAIDRLAASLRRPMRGIFHLAVRNAALYARAREATKAALVRALFESRRALNELAARHGIDREDIYLLTASELLEALDEPGRFDDEIAMRRHQRADLQARQPPFWFEGELPDPSTWPLRSDASTPSPASGTRQGLGVSSGTVTGRARVILDPNDPIDLEPDEVLIARETDPAWTPLFLGAAGVIVEYGAIMSHAAIVARELGIPAVVGVDRATSEISTGTLVTIDGTTGTVTIEP